MEDAIDEFIQPISTLMNVVDDSFYSVFLQLFSAATASVICGMHLNEQNFDH